MADIFNSREDKIKVFNTWLPTFTVLLLFSVLLRVASFFYSVIDHDESTYLVIAQQMLRGEVLYVDVWDTKPIGIFLIFASVIKVAGNSIFAIRFFGAIILALSAYLLHKSAQSIKPSSGPWVGLTYVLLMSCYRFGMAINTELFFNFFVISGLYFLSRRAKLSYLLAGISWGMGFMVKYVVIFDAFAIFFIFSWYRLLSLDRKLTAKHLVDALTLLIAAALPFLLVNLYYYNLGLYEQFIEATFEVPSRYVSEVKVGEALDFLLKFILKFLPAVVLMYRGVLREKNRNSFDYLPLLWFGICWIPVVLPGKYFEHYYAQLLPALALSFMHVENLSGKWITHVKSKWSLYLSSLLLVLTALILGNQSKFWLEEDVARTISLKVNQDLKEGEKIYAGKKLQILYFLTESNPPTKYVHPTLLTFPSHVRTLAIDPNLEFENILAQKPKYLVYKAPHPNGHFDALVQNEYEVFAEYPKSIKLFKLLN